MAGLQNTSNRFGIIRFRLLAGCFNTAKKLYMVTLLAFVFQNSGSALVADENDLQAIQSEIESVSVRNLILPQAFGYSGGMPEARKTIEATLRKTSTTDLFRLYYRTNHTEVRAYIAMELVQFRGASLEPLIRYSFSDRTVLQAMHGGCTMASYTTTLPAVLFSISHSMVLANSRYRNDNELLHLYALYSFGLPLDFEPLAPFLIPFVAHECCGNEYLIHY